MDKITREMLYPKAEKDILAKEKKINFTKRKEKLMPGAEKIVNAKNIIGAHDLVREAKKLLAVHGATNAIPLYEFTKISNDTGYEDVLISDVCELLEQQEKDTATIQ